MHHPVYPHLAHSIIITALCNFIYQRLWQVDLKRLWEELEVFFSGDRLYARNNRDGNSYLSCLFYKIKVFLIIKNYEIGRASCRERV